MSVFGEGISCVILFSFPHSRICVYIFIEEIRGWDRQVLEF